MLYTRIADLPAQKFDRMVSVVPSQTQLLHDLGLDKEVLGITKFCIHPVEWKKEKTIIGGTKNLQINKILSLNPNLIIANKEENVKEQIESLAAETTVFLTDVNNYEDALEMIRQLGALTHREATSASLINDIQNGFSSIQKINLQKQRAIYLIWNEPMMSVGGDTFISSMMEKAGFENVLKQFKRYPTITAEWIDSCEVDCLLLSSEPFPFNDQHLQDFEKRFPALTIRIVDGEPFSWYGSKMLEAPGYFKELRNNLGIR